VITVKKLLLFSVLLAIIAVSCTKNTQDTGLANPASVYCEEQGGTLEIVNEDTGSRGICTLKDGTVCDEWAFYRKECPADYSVTEVLDNTCEIDINCITPVSYSVRSDCPYTTKCLDNKCTVVCPKYVDGNYASVKECGDCPQLMPPSPEFCKEGRVVSRTDDCGCTMPPECQPVYCTEDAKQCPDGSAVGRIPPNCEFAKCPGEE
jgi:putative hemolysin